jgi:hypothetical protein
MVVELNNKGTQYHPSDEFLSVFTLIFWGEFTPSKIDKIEILTLRKGRGKDGGLIEGHLDWLGRRR